MKLKKCDCGGEILRTENVLQWLRWHEGKDMWDPIQDEPSGDSRYHCDQCDKEFNEEELEWED